MKNLFELPQVLTLSGQEVSPDVLNPDTGGNSCGSGSGSGNTCNNGSGFFDEPE